MEGISQLEILDKFAKEISSCQNIGSFITLPSETIAIRSLFEGIYPVE
jgi:hypothetical protein